jgi:hypothetical protein
LEPDGVDRNLVFGRCVRSRAVTAQLAQTEGVVGFSLLARPIRKEYATISLWVDDAALEAFARSQAHGRLSVELAAEMAETRFVRWTVEGRSNPPSWTETLTRLDRPAPFDSSRDEGRLPE